ncbi:Phenolic acid decarboxylase [Fructilactobacillus florum 8D]|uniref:Phenolic acid decarboxylase n=1 Tax=Fructilactobacillus florum 8D TaxID=1221538 RepID=W9ELQ2_9LACO|nr:phenolic acid decarboxylase [Fructilactobacillus florum]ETO40604.1 Phenolic acid decarboxylase [Fructilactobacillus florum 8D]
MEFKTLTDFLGMQLIYQYDNGWEYEIYIKNDHTIDYRIHSGIVAGRWVKDQSVTISLLLPGVYKVAWTEPTGTDVSLDFMLNEKKTNGIIFFPKWVNDDPKRTIGYQNEQLPLMKQYCLAGPTYPKVVVSEFSTIKFMRQRGTDSETVINQDPRTGLIADIMLGKA